MRMTCRKNSSCSVARIWKRSRLQTAEYEKASVCLAVTTQPAVCPGRTVDDLNLQSTARMINVIMQCLYLGAGTLTQAARGTEKISIMSGNCWTPPCGTKRRTLLPSSGRAERKSVSTDRIFCLLFTFIFEVDYLGGIPRHGKATNLFYSRQNFVKVI